MAHEMISTLSDYDTGWVRQVETTQNPGRSIFSTLGLVQGQCGTVFTGKNYICFAIFGFYSFFTI